MGLMPAILLALAGLGVLVFGSRAGAPPDGFLRAAVNGLFGLAALLAVNVTSAYTGIHLGFNLFTGLVAGVLGVPGLVLLVLVQWVIT